MSNRATTRPAARRLVPGAVRATRAVSMAMTVSSVSVSGRMLQLKEEHKTAFIPFLCAGDPSLEVTAAAIRYLDQISADVIELGVPYSDPLADGPVIHGAATRSLARGTKLASVLEMLKSVTPDLKSPIILFTYFNPIRARGLDTFCREIKEAGAAGLLVPDLPLELTGDIREACAKQGLELVLLVTPASPEERMREIVRVTQGFVYLVSVTGVTGARAAVNAKVEGLVETLHKLTDKSIAVGFGVSTGEQAKQLREWGADGVVVGSALVRALNEGGLEKMKTVAKSIRDAIA